MTRRMPAMLSAGLVGAAWPPMSVCTQPGWSTAKATGSAFQSTPSERHAALSAALDER